MDVMPPDWRPPFESGDRKDLPPLNELLPYRMLWEGDSERDAMEQFLHARSKGRLEGYTPVLLVDDFEHIMREQVAADRQEHDAAHINKLLQAAGQCSPERFFSKAMMRLALAWRQSHRSQECTQYAGNALSGGFGANSFLLFQIPVSEPWEVLAHLPYFTAFDGPSVEQMIAILQYWSQRYGAQLLCINFDMLQILFDRERMDDERYHSFAREIFCVLPSLVQEFYQNFDNLVFNLKTGEQPVLQLSWD